MKNINKFLSDNKIILLILFFFSILVYGYAGFNTIINLDGVDDFIINSKTSNYTLYLSVGRWGWSVVGLLFNYYPSSFLCLILNSIMFSLTGVFLGKILNLTKKKYIILLSMILIAFPSNITAYSYIPWQYSIGVGYFVSIYSVYKVVNCKNIKDFFMSSFLIAFATAIYQTFIEVIIVLLMLSVILNLKNKEKTYFKKILLYLLCGIVGLMIYYVIVKLSTSLFNVEMNYYQGANNMFGINFQLVSYYFKTNIIKGLKVEFGYFLPKIVHLTLIFLLICGLTFYSFKVKKDRLIIYSLLLVLFIFCPRTLNFLKPNIWDHQITNIPYSCLFIGGVSLLIIGIDVFKGKKIYNIINKLLTIVLILISTSLMIKANQVFVMAKQSTDASFYYLNRLQSRIEMVDGYNELSNPKKYYLIRYCEGCIVDNYPFSDSAYIDDQGVNWSFLTMNVDTIPAFNILGENVVESQFDYEDRKIIREMLKDRELYPSKDSIFIYKDTVIVKMGV